MSKFLRRPMHEPNDEPRVKPTEAEVAKAIYGVLNRQYGDFNWPDDAAASVLALFTDQPTVTQVKAEALREAADEIAATAKSIRDAHGGAPDDVVGLILAGYGQAEGAVRASATRIESEG